MVRPTPKRKLVCRNDRASIQRQQAPKLPRRRKDIERVVDVNHPAGAMTNQDRRDVNMFVGADEIQSGGYRKFQIIGE